MTGLNLAAGVLLKPVDQVISLDSEPLPSRHSDLLALGICLRKLSPKLCRCGRSQRHLFVSKVRAS